MNEFRVSVIIPSRDRGDKVLATIQSLRNGSVLPNEVVVVDDGSQNHLQELILSQEKQLPYPFPVKVVRHEESHGASSARNSGAKTAKFELLIFLDDDTIATEKLVQSHVKHHFRETSHRSLAMGRLIFHPKLMRPALHDWIEDRGNFREISRVKSGRNLSGGFISANFSIVRSDFLRIGGFDESFPFNRNEDTDFGIRARETGGLSLDFISDALAYHDSEITLERFIRTTFEGGISKAYWSLVRPSSTTEFTSFKKVHLTWKNRQKLESNIFQWMERNSSLANSPKFAKALQNNFESELREVIEIVKNLGIAYGWRYYSTSASQLLDKDLSEISDGELFRYGMNSFEPALQYLLRRTLSAGKTEFAHRLCSVRKSSSWNDLAWCLVYRLRGEEIPTRLLRKIESRSNSGVAVYLTQRNLLRRLEKKVTFAALANPGSVFDRVFGPDSDEFEHLASRLSPAKSRFSLSKNFGRPSFFKSHIFRESVEQLKSYEWDCHNVFSAQRMDFYTSKICDRFFVDVFTWEKSGALYGERKPKTGRFFLKIHYLEGVGWISSSTDKEM